MICAGKMAVLFMVLARSIVGWYLYVTAVADTKSRQGCAYVNLMVPY